MPPCVDLAIENLRQVSGRLAVALEIRIPLVVQHVRQLAGPLPAGDARALLESLDQGFRLSGRAAARAN